MTKLATKRDRLLHLRLSGDEMEQIERAVNKAPAVPRTSVLRAAIAIGLAAIERDPSRILGR